MFPSVSPVFFQIGTVTHQHRLRFRWRGFMYEFLPLIRKARTRCDLCRALHDFARLRLTSQCLPAGNYGWRKCIQRGCLKVSGILVKQPPVCLQYLVFPAVAVVHLLYQAYPCIAQCTMWKRSMMIRAFGNNALMNLMYWAFRSTTTDFTAALSRFV